MISIPILCIAVVMVHFVVKNSSRIGALFFIIEFGGCLVASHSLLSQYYYGDKVENYSWATTYTIL